MSTPLAGAKRLDTKLLVKWGISVGIPLLILSIPTNAVFVREIRMFLVLSIALILVVAFDLFNNMFIPAFLLPAAFYLTGTVPLNIAYGSWTQIVLYVIMAAFVLSAVLEEVGLLRRMAYWCILKFGGSYKGVYWGTFFACMLVSMATFGNAYVLMSAFCYGICKALGLQKSKEAALIMMSGLVGTVTTRIFIWTPQKVGLIEAGVSTIIPNFTIPWSQLLLHMFPVALFCLGLLWIYSKLFKINNVSSANGKEYFEQEYAKLGKMSVTEKKAAFVLALLVIYLVTNPIHGYNVFYGFLLIVPLFFFPGINVGTRESIRSVDFGMIFFVSSCLGIGTVGGYLGVGKILSDMLVPALQPFGPTVASLGILAFGILVNFILTPTAMLTALPGPLTQVALDLGMNPLPFMYCLLGSCDMIFLPYEYVPFLIFFSFGMMSLGDFVKLSVIKISLYFLLTLVVLIPLWNLLGIM